MTFTDRISPLLVALAHELLDRRLFASVEELANFLKALNSGRWQQLPADEQLFWVKRLKDRLGGRDGLSDLLGYEHPVLSEGMAVLLAQEKALARAL
jgi:hypothetical protein